MNGAFRIARLATRLCQQTKRDLCANTSMELTSTSSLLPSRKLLPWLGLLCILAGFAFAVARLHPTNYFGYTEDDSVYFSSAKALAQGKGYLLESFPGTPAATKYPVFYPWLLSWVWRWNPSFPANLVDAIAMNAAFGALFIVMAFFFVRRFKGVGDFEALILAAFCAFHPIITAAAFFPIFPLRRLRWRRCCWQTTRSKIRRKAAPLSVVEFLRAFRC